MTLYYYKLYWRRNFQLTLRQKCMNIQHGYYSHSFMKFPENFKISQIGSGDDLQPPLQPFFPPKYLSIWFQWVSYKADEYIVPWHNMENALIFFGNLPSASLNFHETIFKQSSTFVVCFFYITIQSRIW